MSTIYYDYAPPDYINQVKSTIRLPNRSSLKNVFPIIEWLPKYNLQWFTGDIICAITIGIVTISQAMAYSMIAGLPPQYGLYSTIMGSLVYPFIGTSKDISIGTTAINSLLFGQIMFMVKQTSQYQSGEWTMAYVCATLTLLSGIICFAVGFLRLGILFDFICQPAIAGFMGGSGITIIVNQLPKILGITNIDTTQPTYHIFGHTLLGLPKTSWDAIIGISSLVYIYVIRYYMNIATQRYPRYSTYFFYINITRNIVAIIVSTIISYLINHLGHYENSPFKILGVVPAGLQELRVPTFDTSLISLALPNMVGVVVLQIMEHCSIAVSLGKLSDYKVNINQEISSIGISNIFGSFLSSYPFTGAFSRSAVMSKSGSRTPLTNMFIGIIVIITIYFFTPALAYIPVSAICAVVCSGVTDLITGPKVWVKYWNTHPSEFIIFTCAYILSLVTRIDMSVYVPIGISLVVQLYRMSRPKYAFLGRLDLLNHHHPQNEKDHTKSTTLNEKINNSTNIKTKTIDNGAEIEQIETVYSMDQCIFVAMDDPVLYNQVQPIGHGIVCFQPRENLLFENVNYVYGALMDEIKRTTRRGKPLSDIIGNRPWNDIMNNSKSEEKPILQSVILDLSGVHVMDYSAMEQLAELTRRVEKYCGSPIPWFIVVGNSELVRHSLLYAGFGRQQRKKKVLANTIFSFHNDIKKKKKTKKINNNTSSQTYQLDRQQQYYDQNSNDIDHNHNHTTISINKTTTTAATQQLEKEKENDMISIMTYQSLDYLPQWRDDHSNNDDDDEEEEKKKEKEEYDETKQPIIKNGNIRFVHDRYPYFFRNLHEATKAALEHGDQLLLHNKLAQSNGTISIQIDHSTNN
ncbi:unnamed protein product [Cunninghamella echinulata]